MSLAQKDKTAQKKILPFVTQYHPALPNLKDTLLGKWHLIDNHPLLRNIFKEPPIISYRKGKSLKDILVKAKLLLLIHPRTAGVVQACQHFYHAILCKSHLLVLEKQDTGGISNLVYASFSRELK